MVPVSAIPVVPDMVPVVPDMVPLVPGGILVVGYGNALRTDDGLGWVAAEWVAGDPRFEGVGVLQRRQLTPELALDFSESALVVLIDATTTLPPGVIAVGRIERAADTGRSWSHHVDPPTLVALAIALYGRAGHAFVVSCGVQSLEIGDQLSAVVEAALPRALDAAAELVASHRSSAGVG